MIQTFAAHFIFCITHLHILLCNPLSTLGWGTEQIFSSFIAKETGGGVGNAGEVSELGLGLRPRTLESVSSSPASYDLASVTVLL